MSKNYSQTETIFQWEEQKELFYQLKRCKIGLGGMAGFFSSL